jgi:hypothetical protein
MSSSGDPWVDAGEDGETKLDLRLEDVTNE